MQCQCTNVNGARKKRGPSLPPQYLVSYGPREGNRDPPYQIALRYVARMEGVHYHKSVGAVTPLLRTAGGGVYTTSSVVSSITAFYPTKAPFAGDYARPIFALSLSATPPTSLSWPRHPTWAP